MIFNPSAAPPLVAACAALAERSPKLVTRCIAVQGACEKVAATDLETTLVSAAFHWDQDWILLPAGKLLGALKSIGDAEAEWELVGDVLAIRSKGLRYSLPLMPKGDYPSLARPEQALEKVIGFQAEPFLDAVEAVAPCCSADNARYTMTGICLELGQVVATDGRRLAVAEYPVEATEPFPPVVIPAKVGHILRQVFGDKGHLGMSISKTNVRFFDENVVLTTQQIEGRFPDYKAILPRILAHKIETSKADLIEAIHRIGFMVDRQNNRAQITLEKGSLTIASHHQLEGDASASMEFGWTEEPLTLNLNPQFLLSILKGVNGDTFTLGINTPKKPILITSEGYQGLLMPMD